MASNNTPKPVTAENQHQNKQKLAEYRLVDHHERHAIWP